MAKYGQYGRRPPQAPRPWDIHPVWRGIGCLLMILIPIISYAGAVLLVQANLQQGWLPVPVELSRAVNLPFVGSTPYLLANLVMTAVLTLIGFGVLTSLYSLIYRLVGPSSLGPLDAPPERRHRKRR